MGIGFRRPTTYGVSGGAADRYFTGWDILKDPAIDAELANRLLPAVVVRELSGDAHE